MKVGSNSVKIDRMLKKLVDGRRVLAAGLVRGSGAVAHTHHKMRGFEMFNVMARENVALARRRSIRYPVLGRPKHTLVRYEKLTLAVVIPSDQFSIYCVARTRKDSGTIVRWLTALSKKIEALSP
jgi:hypothetical protein